ncbi:hypothetical protein OG788_02090 [Streptomyces sp. NBC_00647]|uniref:effector-associated constant component EACC1 n=1 Tax=Streptomyces sp. NBC_00647 TaxID=2975796 RepID=UPI0032475DC1
MEILRRFTAQLPAVFSSDLHRALAVQADALDRLGRSEEADQIRRPLASKPAGEATDVQIRTGLGDAEDLQSLLQQLQEEPAFRGRARLVTQPAPTGLTEAGSLAALQVAALDSRGLTSLARTLAAWLVRRRARTAVEITTSDGRRVTVSAERPEEARAALESLLGQEG